MPAALIMTSAFASSANDSQILVKMIEFGLSAAVPFGSFVIRMTAVPAVLSLPGKPTWWLPTGWTKRCTS